MSARRQLIILALLFGTGPLVSCDNSPSPPRISGPTAGITRLEIVGPPTIEPGASVQLRANVTRTNGAVEDVTGEVQWASSATGVVQVSAAGVAASVERGEAVVTATYQPSRSASLRLMVIPAGTFRLSGTITDGGFPVPGVTLTVTAGVGEGSKAVSSANGGYNIYGVSGRVRMLIVREGYLDRSDALDVDQHRSFDFEMTPNGRRLDLGGTYVLTMEVAGCAQRLVENARRRVYDARVEQDGQALTVRLSGADMVVVGGMGDRFSGAIGPDNIVNFKIGDSFFQYYDYYTSPQPGLVERLNEATTLAVNGNVSAQGSSTSISGKLIGTIGLVNGVNPPFWPFSSYCHSDQHRFDMQRQ